jgi:hypothetical protein
MHAGRIAGHLLDGVRSGSGGAADAGVVEGHDSPRRGERVDQDRVPAAPCSHLRHDRRSRCRWGHRQPCWEGSSRSGCRRRSPVQPCHGTWLLLPIGPMHVFRCPGARNMLSAQRAHAGPRSVRDSACSSRGTARGRRRPMPGGGRVCSGPSPGGSRWSRRAGHGGGPRPTGGPRTSSRCRCCG